MSKVFQFFKMTAFSAALSLGTSYADAPTEAGKPVVTDKPVDSATTTQAPTKEEVSQISEAFGNFIGRNLKTTGIDFDIEAIVKGIRDGAAGKPSPLSDADYEKKMIALQESAFKKMAETNLKSAESFLQSNASKQGVKVLEPGKLQILILKEGSGPEVKEGFSPQITYTGKYIDGTVFGSSEDAGGPITIPLDQTIPGFSKGLLGMKEGEKRRIFVHPDLGYGTTGHLQPNSLLIFDVEVIKANNQDDKSALKLNPKNAGYAADEDEDELDDDSDDDGSTESPKHNHNPAQNQKKNS